MTELTTGTAIKQYTILRSLSSGGMGTTYLARDGNGKQVVLKFPPLSMIGDPVLYERYRREVAIGRALQYPYVQRMLDAGEHEGQPFLVTEYVAGETLRSYLNNHPSLPVELALPLLGKLCEGIAACHTQGIFHRDLKPENILVTAGEDVVIIDFGIALLRGARRVTWSGLSNAVGTPDYIAPEQVQGKRGDARTDIYALGAIGYRERFQ